MKNILGKIIGIYALLMLGVFNVKAATIEVGNDTTMAGASGKSVTLELKGDDLKDYTRVEFELDISGTTYARADLIPDNEKFDVTKQGTSTYIIKSKNNGEGLYAATAGKIEYRTDENLSSSFTITLSNVKFYKINLATEEEVAYRVGDPNISVKNGVITLEKPKSTDATLSELDISQGTLTPAFNKDITEYEVKVADKINSLRITATPAQGATRTGTGSKTLNMGVNTFEIEVTAEDGLTKKIYTITVNRGEITEPSAYLKELYLDNITLDLTPAFEKTNNKYTVEITPEVTELNIKYKTEDNEAKVEIEGNENFQLGENKINIKVTASDKSDIQLYEIVANMVEPEEEVEEKKEEITPAVTPKKNKPNKKLIIAIASGCALLIIIIAFLLFRKKRKKKKTSKKEENKKEIKENQEIESVKTASSAESVSGILAAESYDEKVSENTAEYNLNDLKSPTTQVDGDDDKTKEFNLKDYE